MLFIASDSWTAYFVQENCKTNVFLFANESLGKYIESIPTIMTSFGHVNNHMGG